jgi:hypothetical protein
MRARFRAPLAVLGGWLVLAADAAAGVHPLPPGSRPLHLRLQAADAVAIGTVAEVTEGRIAVRDSVALRGELDPAFEIKRAPSRPPPLAAGLQAVLLLRGARPPYVLVDDPRELVVFRDEESVAVWRAALRAALDAGSDGDRLIELYLAWLDGSDEALRETGGAALVDPRAGLPAIGRERALARVAVALDPARAPQTRRISAQLAVRDPAAAQALLAAVPGDGADPQVVAWALRAGLAFPGAALEAAFLRALSDPDGEVRRAAVGVAGFGVRDAAVAAKLRELAGSDPDDGVRSLAIEWASDSSAN